MTAEIRIEDDMLVVPTGGMTEAEVEGMCEKGERYLRNVRIRRGYRRKRREGQGQEEALDALALRHGRSVAQIRRILGWK